MRVYVNIGLNLKRKDRLDEPLELELKEGENTLEHVLQRLSSSYSDLRLTYDGEVSDNLCGLYLNGETYSSFPEGLRKDVADGDLILVDIYVDLISGG